MENPIFLPDFDLSLRRYGKSDHDYHFLLEETDYRTHAPLYANREQIPFYRQFKENLKANYERIIKIAPLTQGVPSIPRKIHQIWLGSPPPKRLEVAIKSWLGWKGWEYQLWTDDTITSLKLRNPELFATLTNPGERSDFLRYEILFQFGGLYTDLDCICLKPAFFDFYHLNYDFYAGLEPIETANFRISCCNAIIGSAPGHPILDALIVNLPANLKAIPGRRQTWSRTGPIYFTKIISERLSSAGNKNMIFPPTVFYPIGFQDTDLPIAQIMQLFKKESAAVHLWEGNWQEEETPEEKKARRQKNNFF